MAWVLLLWGYVAVVVVVAAVTVAVVLAVVVIGILQKTAGATTCTEIGSR